MSSDIIKKLNTPHEELVRIIRDFSGSLVRMKKQNVFFQGVSSDSQRIINTWGKQQPSRFVFQGFESADILIIDSQGTFYTGEEGKLLTNILKAMNLTEDKVFICNCLDIEKTRNKIESLSPKVIITLGEKAGTLLLDKTQPIDQFRGRFYDYGSIKVMPTFHPSLLVKEPQYKRQVWDDMQQVMAYAGL